MNKYIKVLSFLPIALLIASCANDQVTDSEIIEDINSSIIETTVLDTEEIYTDFKQLSEELQSTLLTDIASFIIRKPAAATWETKFNPEFREYYERNKSELEMIYLTNVSDTFYFYLLREARTVDGLQKRGVGGKYIVNQQGKIVDFEEIFVSKVLHETNLKIIGKEYMNRVTSNSDLRDFLAKVEHIEWPDGRLFYSKQKAEWRYVD